MAIDMNRTTIALPGQVSSEIWQKTQESSAVMGLARRIALPGLGVTIPVITGDPEAVWVDETDKKPVKRGNLATKQMTPKYGKAAVFAAKAIGTPDQGDTAGMYMIQGLKRSICG